MVQCSRAAWARPSLTHRFTTAMVSRKGGSRGSSLPAEWHAWDAGLRGRQEPSPAGSYLLLRSHPLL